MHAHSLFIDQIHWCKMENVYFFIPSLSTFPYLIWSLNVVIVQKILKLCPILTQCVKTMNPNKIACQRFHMHDGRKISSLFCIFIYFVHRACLTFPQFISKCMHFSFKMSLHHYFHIESKCSQNHLNARWDQVEDPNHIL